MGKLREIFRKNKLDKTDKSGKPSKIKSVIIGILFLLNTFGTAYLIYGLSLLTGIENLLRLLVAIILALIWFGFLLGYIRSWHIKTKRFIVYIPITIIYSFILSFVAFYIVKTYKTVDKMTTDSTTYSSSLVALSDNDVSDIKDIDKDSKIGILADSTSVDGNQIPKEIIDDENLDNEIMEYDSYIGLIQALYDEEIDYAFLPTNYAVMFASIDGADLENISTETKIIFTQEKEVKADDTTNSNNALDEPFTILIMGVDSEEENIANSSFNGDSLMLITFNPKTLSSTILSIPRDTYVPIMCFDGHRKNKITHAAWYGQDCMIDTIENFTGITIDYYVKINFKGVVKLVDTLGGIEVDVPYSMCEQNSSRQWGTNTVYIEAGLQTLNGEQALAFSRNRHANPSYCSSKWTNYISNDFIRGQHQQTVVRALLNKLKSVRSLNVLSNLLDTISNSMETNMSTSEILSLYNIGKDILTKSSSSNVDELLSMQRLYLSGTDATIYDSGTGLYLYNYVLYDESLAEVVAAMKVNLGLEDPTIVKEFSFNIDEAYEETVIGKGVYSATTSVSKLPDFTGDSVAQATASAKKLGLSVSFKYVTSGSGTNNTVIAQNYAYGYDISYVKSLVLTVLQKEVETTTTEKEETETTTKTTTTTTKATTTQATSTATSEEKTTSNSTNDTTTPLTD